MTKKEQAYYIRLIEDAQKLFKLSLAVHIACSSKKKNVFKYLDSFTYYNHSATHDELYLEPAEEERAAAAFAHCAIYTMVVQLDTVLGCVFSDRFHHPDTDICSAAWISRLLRNAFAHNPLNPVWQIYSECDNKMYKVKKIITLETKGINGVRVTRKHYGGPLSILKLSEFIKREISSVAAT